MQEHFGAETWIFENTWTVSFGNLKSNFRNLTLELRQIRNATPGSTEGGGRPRAGPADPRVPELVLGRIEAKICK